MTAMEMGDAAVSQDTKQPANHHELEEAAKDSPLQLSGGTWFCRHLNFGFPAPKTEILALLL